MEHLVEAQVIDSRHLELKQPIKIAPGSRVMISIDSGESIAEDQGWYLLSSQRLGDATSDDEPEYSLDLIKVPNPDYQP